MRLECRDCGEPFLKDVDGLSLSELIKSLRNHDFWVCNSCLLDEDEDDWWEKKEITRRFPPPP